MMLEALSPSCWSDLYVLKLDGRPWGEYRGRWFSECVDIHLTGRHQLGLEKAGWLGSRFTLTDTADGRILAEQCARPDWDGFHCRVGMLN